MRKRDYSGAVIARALTAIAALCMMLAIGALVIATAEHHVPSNDTELRHDVSRNSVPAQNSINSGTTADRADDVSAPQLRFDDRPVRPVKTIIMRVTAYSPDEQSCGEWADGITASGYSVLTNAGKLVAADTSVLPFGSLVSVPGYDGGHIVPVLDRGGAIKGNRLDVLFPTHEEALEWGVQHLEVTVWEYADGMPNGFREQHHRW